MDFLDFVSPLQGTDSADDFSRGNTLPLVCTPWPMTAWTMQSSAGRWAYSWRDTRIQGIRATHQPSPWMGDHGHFTLMPQVGDLLPGAEERSAGYDKGQTIVRPDYLQLHLQRYATTLEMTPTARCAKFRIQFPDVATARLIIDTFDGRGLSASAEKDGFVYGRTTANDGGVPQNFQLTFCLRFNVPVKAISAADIRDRNATASPGPCCGVIEFDLPADRILECDVATSYLGEEQARTNLLHEIGDASFEDLRSQAAREWNEKLSLIEVSDEEERQTRTFYSCLYRTLTFPHMMHEEEADGTVVHYSPYTGNKHPGVLYAGHGFWDAYRTTYPLYALLFPDKYSELLQGWINSYRESGWYPRWPSPGHRVCMLSTQVDTVFADAVVKGIEGFDLAEAYEGLRRNAFEEPLQDEGFGRPGLNTYLKHGYLPADLFPQSVAATLDNSHCDYCLSEIAAKLGRTEESAQLLERSRFFANVFDAATGFMRGRNADGSWLEPFNEFEWGGPYVEGGAWQTSWTVLHDPQALIRLHGGNEPFLRKLQQMFTLPPTFTAGTYFREIHEMSEMAAAPYGQYAHSNQPVHNVLFLFNECGAPGLADHWVGRILREYYTPEPGGFPGDEDNGEMSAWYILSALGLFPFCPGKPEYLMVAPLFQEATIHLPGKSPLRITSTEAQESPGYILNGKNVAGRKISHQEVLEGGSLAISPVNLK